MENLSEDPYMYFINLMRQYKPYITEYEAEYLLWNETCFPLNDKVTVNQIVNYFENNKKQTK